MALPSTYKSKNFYKTALPAGGWGQHLQDVSEEMITYLVSVVRAGAGLPLGRQTQAVVTAASRVLVWCEDQRELTKDEQFFGLFKDKREAAEWLLRETPRLLALTGVHNDHNDAAQLGTDRPTHTEQ